ncbi:hypothetical protein N0V82_010881 [Gnomoniopsis sp. IMI 355080]|nr:hypothetical protein N0V82_010881 [Gnomoniopsis sp. IMI 355080]
MSAPPPPPKGGMSLYANLLNPKPDASASISSAPVLYDNGDKDDAAKKDVNPALRFQPIRRPQVTQKKPTKPTSFPKSIPAAPYSSSTTTTIDATAAATAPGAATAVPPATTGTPPPQQQRSTLADWAATRDDDEFLYAAQEKRQRGGRKAAKKRKRQTEQQRETDWDEIYDPARPTNVDEYLRSEERVREVQEWKAVLYAHRKRRGTSEDGDSDESEGARMMGGRSEFIFRKLSAWSPLLCC